MKIENIKFKAKRLDNGEWVYGSLIRSTAWVKERAYIVDAFSSMCDYSVVGIDPSTVCQFTGAKDCDGTYIYEHDLLRHEKTDSTYEVVWNQGNTSFSLVNTEYPVLYPANTFGRMLHNRRLKVIGNKLDKEK